MSESADIRTQLADTLRHRVRPMRGRDPAERSRASTPLELLYDLTYVVAFGVAAEELAAGIEHGHIAASIGAYLFALFSVTWAWVSFTWLSSAYGNDDVIFRVATIVQMIGVVILIFGLPSSFEAAAEGHSPNNALLIIGYTVMRLPQLVLWLRAAAQDPRHRRTTIAYAITIGVVQLAWVSTVVVPMSTGVVVGLLCFLAAAEFCAPVVIEKRLGQLPWNPAHLAERFSLLTLITLGEVVAATTAAVGALVQDHGWSVAAVVVVAGGILVAAALWWAYFLIPARIVLPLFPARTMAWRYVHLPIFGAIAAVGAGLRVTAAAVGEPELTLPVTVLAFALPVMIVLILIFLTWSVLMHAYDFTHVPLFLLAVSPIVAAVVVALGAGSKVFDASAPGDLRILVIAVALVTAGCIVDVVGHELVGYEHTRRVIETPDSRKRIV